MHTFVICAKEDKSHAVELLKLHRALGQRAAAYAVSEDWRSEHRRIDELLASSSHVVAIYSAASARSTWLPFLAGISLGSDRVLVLYRPSREPAVEAYLAPFFSVPSLEQLSAFLKAEHTEWTAVSQRREARRELLELGVSFRGDSFAESVKEGNAHAVDLFLKAGFPVDTRDKKGVPLLCVAAREGHRVVMDLLIGEGAAVDLQSEDRGNTALMDAVAGGKDTIVRDLLAAGASVDLVSKDGQTALILAVGKNDVSLAALLLEAGSDADKPDKLGFSARKYAKLFHNAEMTVLFDKLPPVVA